jgi:hypothetical protein
MLLSAPELVFDFPLVPVPYLIALNRWGQERERSPGLFFLVVPLRVKRKRRREIVRILRSSYYTYLTYEQFYWQNLANCKGQDTTLWTVIRRKRDNEEKRSSLSVHSHCLLLIGYKLRTNRFGSPKISLDRIDLDRITSDRFGSNRFTDSTYYPMHAQGIGLQITRYYSALGKPVPV